MKGVEVITVPIGFQVYLFYPSYNMSHFYPIFAKDTGVWGRPTKLHELTRASAYRDGDYPFGHVNDDYLSVAWEYHWGEI